MQLGDFGSLQDQLAAKFGQVDDAEDKDAPTTTAGRLARIVEKVTGDQLPDETRLADIDSLDRIEIAVRAEEEFGVEVNDQEVAGFTTLADAIAFLDSPSD